MYNNLHFVFKLSILFLFWVLFPPFFLIISFFWEMPRKIWRIVLTLIAPLCLLLVIICSVWVYQNYHVYGERGSRKEIESKTGIKFPKYQKVEKRHFTYGSAFGGDFTMEYSLQFDTVNIGTFTARLKKN